MPKPPVEVYPLFAIVLVPLCFAAVSSNSLVDLASADYCPVDILREV